MANLPIWALCSGSWGVILSSGQVGLGWRHVAFGAPMSQVSPLSAEKVQFEVVGDYVKMAFSIITIVILLYCVV